MMKRLKQSQYVSRMPVKGGTLPQPGNAGMKQKQLQYQSNSRRKVLKDALNTLRGQ